MVHGSHCGVRSVCICRHMFKSHKLDIKKTKRGKSVYADCRFCKCKRPRLQ